MHDNLSSSATTGEDPLDYTKFLRKGSGPDRQIDCCFIPTRNPEAIDKKSLSVLRTLCGRIACIPPIYHNRFTISEKDISAEIVKEDFVSWFRSLKHVALVPEQYAIRNFELPLKRTYAVFRAIELGYKQVMFLDDDILLEDASAIKNATLLLNEFSSVSCPAIEFPDASSIDHISNTLGFTEHVFLSGACLLLDLSVEPPFFPQIYNEDWFFFFMTPPFRLACGGVTKQRPYNPFSESRIRFQEAGDFLAAACLTFGRESPDQLLSPVFWSKRKQVRAVQLDQLRREALKRFDASSLIELLTLALTELEKVDEHWCVDFIAAINSDRVAWNTMLCGNIKR